MSTYLYLECLDHDPPLYSDYEVGQHLHDLPRIREDIQRRNVYVANRSAGLDTDYGDSFTNTAARFLTAHPNCRIGIRDEYDRTHPVEDKVATP